MLFNLPLCGGTFIRRYKRFLSDIRLDTGVEITAHCPNPGSMHGCAIPGSKVIVSESQNPNRKLKYTLELIYVGAAWIGVHPLRANSIVEEAIQAGQINELNGYNHVRREVLYGQNSRIDFVLDYDNTLNYLEVKSVTLADNGVAMFPDAPTERGRKHLKELIHIVEQGNRATMFFLVQREDTNLFRPASHIDPEYAKMLEVAQTSGVKILIYDCTLCENGIWVRKKMKGKC